MSSLGNDLARLRKEQDLTLEDIRDKTKIPLRVLQSIEDDTIFTDFDENRTYLRSFVRSYGKALKIDDRVMRIALDQTEAGQYQDLLQKVDPYEPGEITNEPPFTIPDTDAKKERQKRRNQNEQHQFQPDAIRDYSKRQTPSEQSINWVDIGQRFRSMEYSSPVWIIVVLSIVALVVIGYFLINQSNMESGKNPAADSLAGIEQPASDRDSLQLDLESTSDPSANAGSSDQLATLPDTLELIVYASGGKLEPVRVKSDLFPETYPYWLEQGQAMRFHFSDSIKVDGQFSRMTLLLNGHPIEDFTSRFYRQKTGQLHIPRTFFKNKSKWKQPSSSLEGLSVPPPDSIMKRPTFN